MLSAVRHRREQREGDAVSDRYCNCSSCAEDIAALRAELTRVREALTAVLDCIRTEPTMGGDERNPAIADRRAMLVALTRARAVLSHEPAAVEQCPHLNNQVPLRSGETCGDDACWCHARPAAVDGAKSVEPNYPCADCGALRTKAQGGTVFTVCDACWDKTHVAKTEPGPERRRPSLRQPGQEWHRPTCPIWNEKRGNSCDGKCERGATERATAKRGRKR